MKYITIPYAPMPKQLQFHDSLHKFRGFIGGLGSGKSVAGANEAIKLAIQYPGSLGAILAPTYPLLRDSTIRTFFEYLPQELIKNWNKTENVLQLHNGSDIIFRNCDNENSINRLRNIQLGWFWMDEAGLIAEYAWRVVIGRLRQKNAPLKGFITTTPSGFNWIYDKFAGQEDMTSNDKKNYFYVHSSSLKNIHLPEEYVHSLQSEYSGSFAEQEIYGQFVGFEGLVYGNFRRDLHVTEFKHEGEDLAKQFKRVLIGVDWGWTNPTVLLAIGFDGDNRAYIMEEFYQRNCPMDKLCEIARQWARKYSPDWFICDPSEPEHIAAFNAISPITKLFPVRAKGANNEIMPGLNKVHSRFDIAGDGKPRIFISKSCVNVIKELESYRYSDNKMDKPIQENPLKVLDHAMDALRYVIMEAESSNVNNFFIFGR